MIWDATMAVTNKAVNSSSPFLSFKLAQHSGLYAESFNSANTGWHCEAAHAVSIVKKDITGSIPYLHMGFLSSLWKAQSPLIQ